MFSFSLVIVIDLSILYYGASQFSVFSPATLKKETFTSNIVSTQVGILQDH